MQKTSDAASADDASADSKSTKSVTLTHVTSHALTNSTHRPEIVAAPDGTLYLVVVQPGPDASDPSVQVKHQAYHFDANWNQIGSPFPVTTVTSEYGDPSDHRVLIVNNELVVVYQTNLWKDGHPPQNGNGPMEQYSLGQSFMLARFSLDGTLIKRVPIVANAKPGSGENFPDHAMAYHDGHLYITTGTDQQKLKIREVDLDGNILSTHEYDAGPNDQLSSEVGNSLAFDDAGQLVIYCGNGPDSTDSISYTPINDDWSLGKTVRLSSSGREETFPVGTTLDGDLRLIGYISRAAGGAATSFTTNPYSPYLKVLDADGNVLADVRVGESGEQHVHPTIAVSNGRVFVAWSKHVNGMPQVQVDEYSLTEK